MTLKKRDFLSIRMVRVLMKVVGFWPAKSKIEKRLLNGLVGYTILVCVIGVWIEGTELYLGKGDFYAITYTACSVMPLIIILLKTFLFYHHRKELLNMLKYTEDNFWYIEYDAYGSKLLEKINERALLLMCMFTFFAQGTVCTYMLTPIIGILNLNLHRLLSRE